MSTHFRFLDLPLELREQIYSHYFNPADRLQIYECHGGGRYNFEFGLFRTNKQIYSEAQTVWRRECVFVRIETPWPNAVHHISSTGLVPIVAAGPRGDLFTQHRALIQVSVPFYEAPPEHTIILLLDDLHLFTKVWYYSALSHPPLNQQLNVSFTLRDPYYPADPKEVPVGLQRRLLLPFGDVKGLYETEFEGFEESVKEELHKLQATPAPTVQKCCEEAASLMEEGDRLLTGKHAEEALQTYIKAFHAIHIIIEGRTRRVLADEFFHHGIEEGRYSGQTGTTVRIIIRIRLVARCVLAYLRLEQHAEAAYWGMRSIRIMREAMDAEFEDFLAEFVGSDDVGLIYARTAIAFALIEREGHEELDTYKGEDTARPGVLWRCADKYLKGVGKESERKRVVGEAKEFEVEVPDGVLESKPKRAVDSLRHLDLGSLEADGGLEAGAKHGDSWSESG